MKFTALLHVLFMANLVGLLVPAIFLSKQYRQSQSLEARAAIALLHVRLTMFAYIVVVLIVLTGVARVAESHYPWFDFRSMFWLAAKQSLGLLMALFVLLTWFPLRRAAADLRSQTDVGSIQAYDRIKGWSHLITGLAWVMLVLAILKI